MVRASVPKIIEKPQEIIDDLLPEKWSYLSIAEALHSGLLLDLKDGNHGETHPLKKEFTKKGTPFITASAVRDFKIDFENSPKLPQKIIDRLRVGFAKKDDVILTHKASVGRVSITKFNCILSPQTTYYRSNPLGIDNRYLMWIFASPFFQNQLNKVKSQTTRDYVSLTKQYKLFIKLAPINEQKKIVEKVEEFFSIIESLIDSLNKTKFQIEQIKQSYLKFIFDEFSKTCKEETINDVVKIIDYRGRTPPYSKTGIPHLRSNNIKNGKINLNKLKFVSKDTYEKFMTRGIPKTGDLLFTTEAPLGEISLIPNEKFSLAQRLMVLRPTGHDSKFLMYQIMSPDFYLRLTRKKTGTTVTGVSSRNFKPMKILTASIDDEKKIAAEIEKQFTKLEDILINLEKILEIPWLIKNLILKQAFEGKLVPQDPNDESASELLKRIKS